MFRTIYEEPSIEQIKHIFSDAENPYSSWNTTCIQAMIACLIAIRHNKEKYACLLECFNDFILWRRNLPNEYLPSTGLETMYYADELQELHDYFLKTMPVSHGATEEEKDVYKKEFETVIADIRKKYPRPIMAVITSKPSSLLGKINRWIDAHPSKFIVIFSSGIFAMGVASGIMGTLIYQRLQSSDSVLRSLRQLAS
jgi:hypothetical protein